MDVAQQRADLADLGVDAGGDDHASGMPRGDEGAGIGHRAAVSEGDVGRDRAYPLLGGDQFACQNGFVDQQRAGTDQAKIGRNPVARVQENDVAGDDLGHRHPFGTPRAQHVGVRRDEAADRIQGLLRLALLCEADDRVDQHDRENRGGIDVVAEQGCGNCRGQQEIDQRVVKLRQKTQDRVTAGRLRQLVAAVIAEPPGRLVCGQTGGAAADRM